MTPNSDSSDMPIPILDENLGSASSAAVRQYLRAARDYQLSDEQVLDACQLPHGILDNTVSRIKGTEFQSLIKWLVRETQDPLFGLKSSQYVQAGSYSIFGYMIMNCRTPSEILHMIPAYEGIVGDMGVTRLKQEEENIAVSWHCLYKDEDVIPHMVDNVLASWLQFARWLADMPDEPPTRIELKRSSIPAELMSAYERIYRCPIQLNSSRDAILFANELLETQLRQPDPELLANLKQQADNFIKELQGQETITLQVRNILSQLMKQELPRKDKVAAALSMNERTLQRRLQEAGTSYQQLLDDLRRETAVDWLSNTDMNLATIAEKLGFSEARSFHRRFKTWTGLPPGEYRNRYSANGGSENEVE